jgi:hypothetical protein
VIGRPAAFGCRTCCADRYFLQCEWVG